MEPHLIFLARIGYVHNMPERNPIQVLPQLPVWAKFDPVTALVQTIRTANKTKMPLTRHLYEMDEVVAALQLCLRGYHGYTTRALFWAWELVVSDEPGTAEGTIKNTWLAYGGGFDPTLMALKPTEPKHWVSLVLRANEAIHRARDMTVARFMTATAGQGEKPASAPNTPVSYTHLTLPTILRV